MENTKSKDYQEELITQLKRNIPAQHSIVDVVSELLNISQDAAYRRLRGEKRFDIDELYTLCNRFNISLDSIFAVKSNVSLFNYTTLDLKEQSTYLLYMQNFSRSIEQLKEGKDKEIIYSATDIPVFHFMPFKELTLFKLFAWNNTTYNHKGSFESFMGEIKTEQLYACYDKIFSDYSEIPSSEIWTTNTVDNVLRLLDFYHDIGSFEKKETALFLCRQLLNLFDNIKNWVEKGHKGKNTRNTFKFYVSEVELENNFGLFKLDDHYRCVMKLFTINSLSTSDTTFCTETSRWLEASIKRSLLLTGASERERFRYFNTLQQKVQTLIHKISNT